MALVALAVAAGALAYAWRVRREALRRVESVLSRLFPPGDGHPGAMGLEPGFAALDKAADITSVRITAAELAAQRLAGALDLVGVGVVVSEAGGHVVFRNGRAAALLGDGMGEALARSRVAELLGAAALGEQRQERLELLGPPRRTLDIEAAPVLVESRPAGAAAVIEDVSENRRLQEVRRDFVANLSHELKTPVGALALLAEALAAEDEPEVTARLVGRMQVEALRVARIIEDLLDLSRIEAEESPAQELLSLGAVIGEAVERVRPLAELRKIAIRVEEGAAPFMVMGDRRQLVAAVHSLVENGVTYSEDGGEVRVKTTATGSCVEVVVADDGIGIPTRDIDRIFERFYRVDRGRGRDTGGTGLGLAIVRHVAGNHGGRVTVQSQEGRGSTFTLELPAAPVAVPGEAG